MTHTRRILSFLIILSMLVFLSGCKVSFYGRTEMSNIEFIRAIGVDKCPGKEETVKLTIATQSVKSGVGGGDQNKESQILHSEGRTVFEAIRNYWNFMDKRPFWGHLEYIIVGEEAAKDGLLKYIDCFSRDPEMRLNIKVFVANKLSAEEVIETGNRENKFIFERLKGVSDNQWGQSIFSVVDLIEVIYILERNHQSLFIPCIELARLTEDWQGENSSSDIIMGGFAIFEGDKLAGHLDDEMGRGLNWLKSMVKSSVIVVKSPKGNDISLEVINSNSKLEPKIINGDLNITIKTRITSNINEIQSREDIYSGEIFSYLENQQNQVIKSEIEDIIRHAQGSKMDFIGAGDVVFRKYPFRWEDEYEKDWRNIFSDIKFNVVVDSRIRRTYDIK